MSDSEFDESDDLFMANLSDSLAKLIPNVFPALIEFSGKRAQLKYAAVNSLGNFDKRRFFSVLDTCIGAYYLDRKGPNWGIEKVQEMAEEGLLYVWYELEGEITCFISFKIVLEAVGKTLYLYEIHVLPKYQLLRLGSFLLDSFHKYASYLVRNVDQGGPASRHYSLAASGLTVFSDNERALKWYFKNGYQLAEDSPRDRRLRNGRIQKPSFYLLTRLVDQ